MVKSLKAHLRFQCRRGLQDRRPSVAAQATDQHRQVGPGRAQSHPHTTPSRFDWLWRQQSGRSYLSPVARPGFLPKCATQSAVWRWMKRSRRLSVLLSLYAGKNRLEKAATGNKQTASRRQTCVAPIPEVPLLKTIRALEGG